MFIARYWLAIPMLAIAGSLAAQEDTCRPAPARCRRTRRCSSCCWSAWCIIVGALTFVPALALGPIVEHLQMIAALATQSCESQRIDKDHDHVHCTPKLDRCLTRRLCGGRLSDSFIKLDPRDQVRNPVMFAVFVGSVLTTVLVHSGARCGDGRGIGRVHRRRFGVALVHGAVRQLRRSDGRRARQGPGRRAAASRAATCTAKKLDEPQHGAKPTAGLGRRRCARATSCWSRPATSFPATAKSSKASPRSMKAPSPAKARRSSAKAAATAAASPAARACSPTGWSCASPPIRARRFSIA